MRNTIIKETENFTAYRTIGGDMMIEKQNGDCVMCLSGASPEDCARWEQWAMDADDAELASEYADNNEE